MEKLKPVDEQCVVVVGASRGIGRATAEKFAERGARVVLAARDEEAIEQVAADIRGEGGRAVAVPVDVADLRQVEELGRRAADAFGAIDTWVNDAAVTVYGRFEDITPEEFRRVMDVNFFGQMHGCRVALPYLNEQGKGALICIGSIVSDRAVPLQAPYSASKAALKGLVDSLRVELAMERSGVQLTFIKPSSINTPLFDDARTKLGKQPKPVPPVYEPSIVADTIVHCAEHREREVVVGGGGAMADVARSVRGPGAGLVLYEDDAGGTADRSAEGRGCARQPGPATAPDALGARQLPGQVVQRVHVAPDATATGRRRRERGRRRGGPDADAPPSAPQRRERPRLARGRLMSVGLRPPQKNGPAPAGPFFYVRSR